MSVEVCHLCRREFPSYASMMRHMQVEHPETYALIQRQLAEQAAAARDDFDAEARITDAMRRSPEQLAPWDKEALRLED